MYLLCVENTMLEDLECLLIAGDGLTDQSNVYMYTWHTCHPLTSFSSFPHQTSEQEQAPGPPRTAFPEHPEAHQTVSSIHLYSLPCILSGLGLTDIVIVTVCLCHMVLEGQRLTSCSVRAGWLYWPVKTSSVRLWMAFPLRKREATPAWTYYMNCPSMKTVFTGSCPCVFLASVWMKPTALLPTARFLLLTVQKLWVSRSMVWWKNEKKKKVDFHIIFQKSWGSHTSGYIFTVTAYKLGSQRYRLW